MIFYGVFLLISLSLVFILNAIFGTDSAIAIFLFIALCFVMEVVIDTIVALIVHKLPENRMNPERRLFKIFSFEKKFYESIGIKKWKNYIPETGQLCDFKKDKIYNPGSKEYLYKFIRETCYAELMHGLCVILSFLILFLGFYKPHLIWSICLPCAFINGFTQIWPFIIQRYTRPKLMNIYKIKTKMSDK